MKPLLRVLFPFALAAAMLFYFQAACHPTPAVQTAEGVALRVADDTCQAVENQPEPAWVTLACLGEGIARDLDDAGAFGASRVTLVKISRPLWETMHRKDGGLSFRQKDQTPNMFYLIDNQSSKLPIAALSIMAHALSFQAEQFADAHGRLPAAFAIDKANRRDPNLVVVQMIDDDPTATGELGDHSVDEHGNPMARILVNECIDNAGTADPLRAVTPVLSHEFVETEFDLFANMWFENGKGGLTCGEVADPDQGTTYDGPEGTLLSNFMLRDYFDPSRRGAKTNYVGTPLAPCGVAPNGYILEINHLGRVTSIFGEKVTPRQKIKALCGRLGRRMQARGEPILPHIHKAACQLAALEGDEAVRRLARKVASWPNPTPAQMAEVQAARRALAERRGRV